MVGRFKFVCIALVMTLLVLPVAALSACWIPMPATQEMAMGDAGMTANMPVSIQQGPASGSCCQLSAADAPPVSVPRAPERGVTNMATTGGASVLEVPPTAIKAELSKAQSRGSGSSLQATLCVFLI
jgi:hypothetical protein